MGSIHRRGKKKKDKLSLTENFLLSGVAAVVSKTAACPIERIKLLIQNQDEMLKAGRLNKPYTGIIDCTKRIATNEGIVSFWRGNLANCIRYFPTQLMNFALKERIRTTFNCSRRDSYKVSFAKNIASGGAAGGISLMFVYSLDYARTRLGNDIISSKNGGGRQFTGLIDVYKKTLASDGVAGLYRGFMISCLGIVVYRGCYFGFYDSLRPILLGENASLSSSLCLGYGVTVTAGLISYPIDTIRRRMMMTSGEKVVYGGSIQCFKTILASEGFTSLFKGNGANILRGMAGAIILAGFDEFKATYVRFRNSSLNRNVF